MKKTSPIASLIDGISGFHSSLSSKGCCSWFQAKYGRTLRMEECRLYQMSFRLPIGINKFGVFLLKNMSFSPSKPETERQNMINNISEFVKTDNKVYCHRKYCYGYLLCLALSVIIVIVNFILLDQFLGGEFIPLGARLLLLHSFLYKMKVSSWF